MSMEQKIFGVLGDVLRVRGYNQEVIANNIANQDTPNFKSASFSIEDVMKTREEIGGFTKKLQLSTTSSSHIGYKKESWNMGRQLSDAITYKEPTQASLDGNTVEGHVEMNKLAENAIRYQATLDFLSSKIRTLKSIIRGE